MITFSCYGCHLHGAETGSVDRKHNLPGGRVVEPDPERVVAELGRMNQASYSLGGAQRETVLTALRERCAEQHWGLLAAHVRSTHVHAVVRAESPPERIMNDLKSFASRRLNELGEEPASRKRWTRHGSTKWLWNDASISAAIRYVVDEQGEKMAAFEANEQPPLPLVAARFRDL